MPSITAYPGSATNSSGAGTQAWLNASNALADDGAYASIALTALSDTQWLLVNTFDFSAIPAGSTIDGIEVTYRRFASGTQVRDLSVRLVKTGSTLVGTDQANTSSDWPTSEAARVYGGSADTWSSGLTLTDIQGSGFGVAIRVKNNAFATRTPSVDAVSITVYYTPSSQHYDETSGEVTVLAITAGADTLSADETGGSQLLLATLTGIDGMVYTDLSGSVTLLVTLAGADQLVMAEHAGSVLLRAVLDGEDWPGLVDAAGSVALTATLGGHDTLAALDTSGKQLILATLGGTDGAVVFDHAGVVLLTATFNGSDLLTTDFHAAPLLLLVRVADPYAAPAVALDDPWQASLDIDDPYTAIVQNPIVR